MDVTFTNFVYFLFDFLEFIYSFCYEVVSDLFPNEISYDFRRLHSNNTKTPTIVTIILTKQLPHILFPRLHLSFVLVQFLGVSGKLCAQSLLGFWMFERFDRLSNPVSFTNCVSRSNQFFLQFVQFVCRDCFHKLFGYRFAFIPLEPSANRFPKNSINLLTPVMPLPTTCIHSSSQDY